MLCVWWACVGRERLRAVRSVLSSLSSRSSVRSAEEDEMSDAWCWSLSVIDMDSLMEVRDSLIPMSVVSMASLESYPAERSEVWDHPSAANTVYEELGSRNPRWD